MTLQALRTAGRLREGGGKVCSRWQTPCPCWGLVNPEPFLTPSHLPFSYSGLLWYFQRDSKVHSMKTIIVLAFAHHMLSAKQTLGYISSQHQSIINQLCCLWFRAIHLKKVWNPVCKALISQKGILQSRNTAQCRYYLLIQMIYCTIKNAKKNFYGSIKKD